MTSKGLHLALLTLVVLGLAGGAVAQEHPPGRITVAGPAGAASGPAGSAVTIRGAGFQPGDQIELHWNAIGGPVLATAAGRTFQVGATIPVAPPGTYKVLATGFDQDGAAIGQAAAQFTIVSAPVASGPGPGPGGGSSPIPLPPDTSFAGCSAPVANLIIGPVLSATITGTPAGDRIFAGAGNDVVRGRAGNDCIDLGAGSDRAAGGSGGDLILGRGGRDRLSGGPGRDRLSGGSGRDRISARDGTRDRISCGAGADRVVADRVDRISRGCERVRRVR